MLDWKCCVEEEAWVRIDVIYNFHVDYVVPFSPSLQAVYLKCIESFPVVWLSSRVSEPDFACEVFLDSFNYSDQALSRGAPQNAAVFNC